MSSEQEILRLFAGISDVSMMRRLFNELLTESERHDLVLRWKLLKMLRDGIPQREIASRLHISLCKITRGAKILKDEQSVVRKLLESIE